MSEAVTRLRRQTRFNDAHQAIQYIRESVRLNGDWTWEDEQNYRRVQAAMVALERDAERAETKARKEGTAA